MSGYGMKSHIMVQLQNSFGTVLTSSLVAFPVKSSGLLHSIDPLNDEGGYGRFDPGETYQGKHMFEGDVELNAHPIPLGWLFSSHIGYTQTTSASGSQVHEFDPATSDFDGRAAMPPLTIEQHLDVGSAGLFGSMIGNALTMNFANGELMSITGGFMGAGYSKKANESPVYTEDRPFKWDQSSIVWGGMQPGDFRDMTLTYNNNLESYHTMVNCPVPYKIKRNNFRTIELSGTMIFQTHSFYDAFKAGTHLQVVMNFASGESPNNLTIDMPKVFLKTYDPVNAGPGIIEAPFTADVKFSSDSNTALHITLTNTYEGYLVPTLT